VLGGKVVPEPPESLKFVAVRPEDPEFAVRHSLRMNVSLLYPVVHPSRVDLQLNCQIGQPPFIRGEFVAGKKRLA
jgi:hypothetical protein